MRRQTFSLPTQRYFLLRNPWVVVHELFSAYAEVFPDDYDHHLEGGAFLCLRRGVSEKEARLYRYRNFSLPTQRCFHQLSKCDEYLILFSAYAEVFPDGQERARPSLAFLCLRRGVSLIVLLHASAVIFSLPTQWCFWVDRFDLRFTVLFSAYAEVFPTLRFFSTAVPAFLCLRRGVSTLHIVNHYTNSFSLPTQRCFH